MRHSPPVETERFLTFEAESALYALPIAEVHEVAEVSRVCCVPTCSPARVRVMNWHGDALPVVSAPLLLGPGDPASAAEVDADEVFQPVPDEKSCDDASVVGGAHVLVVSSRDDEPAQLGMPIDRVIGLADGPRQPRGVGGLVVEKRPMGGFSVSVLDPRRLVERATEVIEGAV